MDPESRLVLRNTFLELICDVPLTGPPRRSLSAPPRDGSRFDTRLGDSGSDSTSVAASRFDDRLGDGGSDSTSMAASSYKVGRLSKKRRDRARRRDALAGPGDHTAALRAPETPSRSTDKRPSKKQRARAKRRLEEHGDCATLDLVASLHPRV
mmetsp:Transcript_125400/g.362797  ORF Transcript_125400/g.362797 Transcript_125400/m.362797 type:complete len:153 (+) Transcript_125400:48-506(+)